MRSSKQTHQDDDDQAGASDLFRVEELERQGERFSARLTAGFCWPWSNPTSSGELVPDVQVGEWQMPWNTKSGAGRLVAGIPKENFWTSDPNGIEQVGFP